MSCAGHGCHVGYDGHGCLVMDFIVGLSEVVVMIVMVVISVMVLMVVMFVISVLLPMGAKVFNGVNVCNDSNSYKGCNGFNSYFACNNCSACKQLPFAKSISNFKISKFRFRQ